MGELRTWTDKSQYIRVLEKEISVLRRKYEPHEGGTKHFNTAISVLESRIKEIESEMNWPFSNK